MKPIPPTGNSNAKLLIVGEAPGEQEEIRNENLVGPTGQIVQQDVTSAGMDWGSVLRTNVFPWRPPNNDLRRISETGHTIEEGKELLKALVQSVKPNLILTLGDLAFKTCTGYNKLGDWRGSILHCIFDHNVKVVPTRHPAWLFKRDPTTGKMTPFWWRNVIKFDITRAVKESRYSTFDLPMRTIRIVGNTSELYSFIKDTRSRPRPIVSVDIESHKTIPDCIGLANSPNNCIIVPLLKIPYARNMPEISIRELASMHYMLAEFLEDEDILCIGQNLKYDNWRLRQATGIRIRRILNDIMVMFHVAYPELPKKLGFITSILTREPFYKDEGKEFNFSKDPIQQRYIYCGKDACVSYEAFLELEKELLEMGKIEFSQYLTSLIPIYTEQEQTGFNGNQHKRAELLLKYELDRIAAESELFSLAGGRVNIRSTAHEIIGKRKEGQLPALLKSFGFPDRASYNEDSLTAMYAHNAKTDVQKRVIDLVLTLRGLYGTESKLLFVDPDWDNNYRSIVNPYATETGRSSTQIMGYKNPYRLEANGHSFHSVTKRGFGSDVRTIYTCDEDEWIVELDFSQAEPRVVAHLCDDYELLKMFTEGTIDIHKWTAQFSLGLKKPWQEVTKSERFIGKTCRNAGNLGAGAGRYTQTVNTDAKKYNILGDDGFPIRITEGQGGKMLQGFHRFSPRVRAIFHGGTQEALRNNGYVLTNPFGRPRRFMGRREDESTFKEAYAYMASSPVSDHLKHCIIRISERRERENWKTNVRFVLDYHDALVFRIKDKIFLDVVPQLKELMEVPIDFSQCSIARGKLLIPVEIKRGKNYGQMEDVKL